MIVYDPRQVEVIYPYIDFDPGWFILGGPADATEAQDMREKFPNVCIIGFEPNPMFYNVQLARGFPGRLVQEALWRDWRELELKAVSDRKNSPWQDQRNASAVKYDVARYTYRVRANTLDNYSLAYGPFEDVILWIDIEESELPCLEGAVGLMSAGQIRLVNAEVHDYRVEMMAEMLGRFGIREVGRWNANTVIDEGTGSSRSWWNIIYKRG
jgi:hypothetical protein